jgi:hypothetical protein
MTNLTSDQLVTYCEYNELLNRIEAVLPEALREEMERFGMRVGFAWKGITPNKQTQRELQIPATPPTQEEAKELFGRVYLAIDNGETRTIVRLFMKAMDMELPSRQSPGGTQPGKSNA